MDAVVERALEALRALTEKGERKPTGEPAAPLTVVARESRLPGTCFHCGGTGRCYCIACDPPGDCRPCQVRNGWFQ